MIKITDELALVKFDDLNFAIVKGHEPKHKRNGYGNRVLGYFGDIQSALKASLNYAILANGSVVEIKNTLEAIQTLTESIKTLSSENICSLCKEYEEERTQKMKRKG